MRTRRSTRAPDATPTHSTHTAPDDQLAVDDPAVAETAVAAPPATPDANHVNIIASSESDDCNVRTHTLPPPTHPLVFPPPPPITPVHAQRAARRAHVCIVCREEARERASSRHTTTAVA
jgi:hypothetical protein